MQAPTYQTNILGRGIAIAGLLLIIIGVLAPIQCSTDFDECRALLEPNPDQPFLSELSWESWVVINSNSILILSPILAVMIAIWVGDRQSIALSTLALASTVGFTYINIDYQMGQSRLLEYGVGKWFLLVGGFILLLSGIPKSLRPDLTDEEGNEGQNIHPDHSMSHPIPKHHNPQSRALRITTGFVVIGVLLFVFGGTYAPIFCAETDTFFGGDCSVGGDFSLFHRDAFDNGMKFGVASNYFSMIVLAMSVLSLIAIVTKRQVAKLVMGAATLSIASGLSLVYYAIFEAFENDFFELAHWGLLMLLGGPSLILLGTVMTHSLTQSTQHFDEDELQNSPQPAQHSLFTLSDGETDSDEETSPDAEET